MFFKSFEFQTLVYINAVASIFIHLMNYFHAERYNLKLGISDMTVLLFGSFLIYGTKFALVELSAIVLFQKLIPPHVEATMMAFSMGVLNISLELMGQIIGVIVNQHYIGITEYDL